MIRPNCADFTDPPFTADDQAPVVGVTELVKAAADLVAQSCGSLVVRGELAEWTRASSGHCYGTLRDERSQIAVVMFRQEAARLEGDPSPGVELLLFGRIAVYERRGRLQLIVREIRLGDGRGLAALARERLLADLRSEGLLNPARKRSLPGRPAAVGLVTSPGSAALRDVTQEIGRRAPWTRVVVAFAPVEGAQAPERIACALGSLAGSGLVPVIILARGGGSAPDLEPFDSEEVARAIAASSVPVVTAVGHEADFSVADAVADSRAATPSAAVALTVPDATSVARRISGLRDSAGAALTSRARVLRGEIASVRQRLPNAMASEIRVRQERLRVLAPERIAAALRSGLLRSEERANGLSRDRMADGLTINLVAAQERLTSVRGRLARAIDAELQRMGRSVESVSRDLEGRSPIATLVRGYCFVETKGGRAVSSVRGVRRGDSLRILTHDGEIEVTVDAVRSPASSSGGVRHE